MSSESISLLEKLTEKNFNFIKYGSNEDFVMQVRSARVLNLSHIVFYEVSIDQLPESIWEELEYEEFYVSRSFQWLIIWFVPRATVESLNFMMQQVLQRSLVPYGMFEKESFQIKQVRLDIGTDIWRPNLSFISTKLLGICPQNVALDANDNAVNPNQWRDLGSASLAVEYIYCRQKSGVTGRMNFWKRYASLGLNWILTIFVDEQDHQLHLVLHNANNHIYNQEVVMRKEDGNFIIAGGFAMSLESLFPQISFAGEAVVIRSSSFGSIIKEVWHRLGW